ATVIELARKTVLARSRFAVALLDPVSHGPHDASGGQPGSQHHRTAPWASSSHRPHAQSVISSLHCMDMTFHGRVTWQSTLVGALSSRFSARRSRARSLP